MFSHWCKAISLERLDKQHTQTAVRTATPAASRQPPPDDDNNVNLHVQVITQYTSRLSLFYLSQETWRRTRFTEPNAASIFFFVIRLFTLHATLATNFNYSYRDMLQPFAGEFHLFRRFETHFFFRFVSVLCERDRCSTISIAAPVLGCVVYDTWNDTAFVVLTCEKWNCVNNSYGFLHNANVDRPALGAAAEKSPGRKKRCKNQIEINKYHHAVEAMVAEVMVALSVAMALTTTVWISFERF